MTPTKLRENLVVVSLSQQKLREQVEGLVGRMNSRLVEPDPAFLKIADLLPKAAEEMKAAEKQLQAQAADNALPPENRALQQLQKAEEEYEKQVSQQRGGGGGGGGGAGSISEDLADLFKQDLDKLANQYETAQSAQQQQSDQQVDAVMEKLRELARRQEQEAERQRQQALAGQMGQGGGDSQRQLAEQAEEAARQIWRRPRSRCDRPPRP
jgi:colicin import membrane protein